MNLEAKQKWHRYYLIQSLSTQEHVSAWEAFDTELKQTYRLTIFQSPPKEELKQLQEKIKNSQKLIILLSLKFFKQICIKIIYITQQSIFKDILSHPAD